MTYPCRGVRGTNDRSKGMSDQTCMTWIGGRATGTPCRQPATARRGARCLNGCYGEGAFEYSCDDHLWVQKVKSGTCARCGAEVELFASQPVAVTA